MNTIEYTSTRYLVMRGDGSYIVDVDVPKGTKWTSACGCRMIPHPDLPGLCDFRTPVQQ